MLLYASAFPEEFDTGPMLRLALDLGKRLLCPRVIRPERRLGLFEIRDLPGDFSRGTLGIPEPRAGLVEVDPKEVDWALVPGLGYDPRCYRIGRGAGHYDRLLLELRPDAPRWSLCLSSQWVDVAPRRAPRPAPRRRRRPGADGLHGSAIADHPARRPSTSDGPQ